MRAVSKYLQQVRGRGSRLPRTIVLRRPSVYNSRFATLSNGHKANTQQIGGAASQIRSFASYPPYNAVQMPALSPTMEKGTIAAWRKKEGDEIQPGDLLAEVETDKATVDFESQEEGYLAKILVPDGTADVPLGKVVAIMVDDKDSVAAFKDFSESEVDSGSAETEKPAEETPSQPPSTQPSHKSEPQNTSASTQSSQSTGSRVFISPLARKIAGERGIELARLAGHGTGPRGRVTRDDVERFLQAGGGAQEGTEGAEAISQTEVGGEDGRLYLDIPVEQQHKQLVDNLVAAKKNVPHYYLTREINLDKVLLLRERLNGVIGNGQLSMTEFVMKAASNAMKKVPEVNASWLDDGYIRYYQYVDINVSMASQGHTLSPVVRDVNTLGLAELSNAMSNMSEKAEQGQLTEDDAHTGTFTITNMGAFGVRTYSAIVNPPQACVLSLGTAQDKVALNDSTEEGAPLYKKTTSMNVTLSCDHRVVDGAVGAQWLQVFASLLEDPETMLL